MGRTRGGHTCVGLSSHPTPPTFSVLTVPGASMGLSLVFGSGLWVTQPLERVIFYLFLLPSLFHGPNLWTLVEARNDLIKQYLTRKGTWMINKITTDVERLTFFEIFFYHHYRVRIVNFFPLLFLLFDVGGWFWSSFIEKNRLLTCWNDDEEEEKKEVMFTHDIWTEFSTQKECC